MEDDSEQFLVTLGLAVVLPVGVCLCYFLFAPKPKVHGLALYLGTRPPNLAIANDVLSFLLAFFLCCHWHRLYAHFPSPPTFK